eukprot:300879_1
MTKQHTFKDFHLVSGLIRETNIQWIVSKDIINLLLLFCTIGDNFDVHYTNKRINIVNNDSDQNKYNSKYQTIDTLGSLNNLMSEYSDVSKANRFGVTILHAFGTKQVSRVKYKWNLSFTLNRQNIYIGIIDSEYVKSIYKNENKYIPEMNKDDYFFSTKYHGYGLSIPSGDMYHNNSKYGKPYVLNTLTHNDDIFRGKLSDQKIITIELDLTGKIYGSLKYKISELNYKRDITEYWNDICFAYDDILVHRKYQLVVAMEDMVSVMLFDDYLGSV